MSAHFGLLVACAVAVSVSALPETANAGGAAGAFAHADAAQMSAAPAPGVADYGGPSQTARCDDAADLVLAQLQLRAAPSGNNYIQLPGRRQFQKLKTNTSLASLDCVEINCPASFPADATCWRCREQIKAPED